MILKLKLVNFRNYQNSEFKFEKKTIICGNNGVGKTNILEAINICSTAKSFRGSLDNDLIKWEEDFYRLEADIKTNTVDQEILEIIFQKQYPLSKKVAKINKVKINLSGFIGHLKTVVYSFESSDLIIDGPAKRRRFLDTLLCQIFPKYTVNLMKMLKVIKNRNQLLFKVKEGIAKMDELDFWDEELCQLSKMIVSTRQDFLDYVNLKINQFYDHLSPQKEKISLHYELRSIFDLSELRKNRDSEIRNCTTLYGPHRDDILFFSGSHKVADTFSRGETKSLLFSLKKCEAEYIYEKTKEMPVILIDDILAELDQERRNRLDQFVENNQVIATSTDHEELKILYKKSKLIMLNG